MRLGHFTLVVIALAATVAVAQDAKKIKQIQAVVKSEPWAGWGRGEPLPEGLKAEQSPEHFTRIPPAQGAVQKFSGKVVGLKPEQKAEIGIVSLKGVHWISGDNYEWSPLDKSQSFSVTSTKNPAERKTLTVKTDTGQWTFLRAEFEPGEGASDVELHVKPARKVVITMEDPQGNAINNFRGEIFNAYVMTDDQGHELRPQRFGNPSARNGAMILDLPAEPFGILLAADKVAPYYEVIDPREAGTFNFRMLAAARVKGVVTRNGQPAADEGVFLVNEAAPMSASRRKTDRNGRFDVPGRVPGVQHVTIGGYESDVPVKPGETAELKIDLSSVPATAPATARAK